MSALQTSYFIYVCLHRRIRRQRRSKCGWLPRLARSRRARARATTNFAGVLPMLIDTRAIGFALTGAIRRHVESRVGSALAPVAGWVLNVTARVEDVNADRGGID